MVIFNGLVYCLKDGKIDRIIGDQRMLSAQVMFEVKGRDFIGVMF